MPKSLALQKALKTKVVKVVKISAARFDALTAAGFIVILVPQKGWLV